MLRQTEITLLTSMPERWSPRRLISKLLGFSLGENVGCSIVEAVNSFTLPMGLCSFSTSCCSSRRGKEHTEQWLDFSPNLVTPRYGYNLLVSQSLWDYVGPFNVKYKNSKWILALQNPNPRLAWQTETHLFLLYGSLLALLSTSFVFGPLA